MMIKLKDIGMKYENTTSPILNNVTLTVNKNDWVTVLGASGSGKTTLLNIIGGLLPPSEGTVHLDEKNLYDMKQNESQRFRRHKIGFIYQDFKLFNQYTVLENVMVPQLPYKLKTELEEKAKLLLDSVGLTHRLNQFPTKLSGGEKQRVAIARALLSDPDILLCDEPTGNLDSKNTENIMEIIQSFHQKGLTILFVTHDQRLVAYGNRLLMIHDGNVKELKDHESTRKEKSY